MAEKINTPVISYLATCHNCKATFEAFDTAWCACWTAERSLVCTNCLTCACKAPPFFKKNFWAEAPEELWGRKMEFAKKSFEVPPSRLPEEMGRPRVLVVDPAANVKRVAVRASQELRFELILASDGIEGLDFISKYRPELVLAEAFLPKLDGREMGRRVKATDGYETKVVVATSLYTSTAHKYEALRDFKLDDYLIKPVDYDALLSVIRRMLDLPEPAKA